MKDYLNATYLPKVISGTDTLYYFHKSNENYNTFFQDLMQQLESNKKRLDDMNISYENRDLKVFINNVVFEFNGKAKGFYWFTHIDKIFTVGFKDNFTNTQVHDIQIQLDARGIYDLLGFKILLEYVNNLFKSISTEYRPVTRVDLNMFVQADLSWITKDMFVSRKRKYTTYSKEITSKYKLETLYIGKPPFLLRLYDKKLELEKSHKKGMMYNYFETYGFNTEDDIFNIEFEMHRVYLRSFHIDTVEDLLGHAEELFKEAMEAIRLVDLSTISTNSINSSNRYKAQMHPLWKHIKDSYKLTDFMAFDKPLVKKPREKFLYTEEEAIIEHAKFSLRAESNNIIVDELFFSKVLKYLKRYTASDIKKSKLLSPSNSPIRQRSNQ